MPTAIILDQGPFGGSRTIDLRMHSILFFHINSSLNLTLLYSRIHCNRFFHYDKRELKSRINTKDIDSVNYKSVLKLFFQKSWIQKFKFCGLWTGLLLFLLVQLMKNSNNTVRNKQIYSGSRVLLHCLLLNKNRIKNSQRFIL